MDFPERTNHDCPEVYENKEGHECKFLQGEDERKQVVWYALGKTVYWMESVAGERRRHDPFVMRFVECFVDTWVVQATMDPINAKVGENEEEREL